jgi:hypothetical protein
VVHDDATERQFHARAPDRRSDPIAGILDPAPGSPVRVSDGSPRPTCGLDGDEMVADADDGDAGHFRERTWSWTLN